MKRRKKKKKKNKKPKENRLLTQAGAVIEHDVHVIVENAMKTNTLEAQVLVGLGEVLAPETVVSKNENNRRQSPHQSARRPRAAWPDPTHSSQT